MVGVCRPTVHYSAEEKKHYCALRLLAARPQSPDHNHSEQSGFAKNHQSGRVSGAGSSQMVSRPGPNWASSSSVQAASLSEI